MREMTGRLYCDQTQVLERRFEIIKQCFRKSDQAVTQQMPGEGKQISEAQEEGFSGCHVWSERGLDSGDSSGYEKKVFRRKKRAYGK